MLTFLSIWLSCIVVNCFIILKFIALENNIKLKELTYGILLSTFLQTEAELTMPMILFFILLAPVGMVISGTMVLVMMLNEYAKNNKDKKLFK